MAKSKSTIPSLSKQLKVKIEAAAAREAIAGAVASSSKTNKELSDKSWLDPRKLEEPITV